MNAKRRTLADVVGPAALEHPQIPERPPRPATPADPSAAATPDPGPADAPPRPSARTLVAPRRQVAREALKADVPAELGLLQRLHRCRLDTGIDIRDQVALAVDEWLTSQGY